MATIREFAELEGRLLGAYSATFENYAWTDVSTAIDLFRAEVAALRHEKQQQAEEIAHLPSHTSQQQQAALTGKPMEIIDRLLKEKAEQAGRIAELEAEVAKWKPKSWSDYAASDSGQLEYAREEIANLKRAISWTAAEKHGAQADAEREKSVADSLRLEVKEMAARIADLEANGAIAAELERLGKWVRDMKYDRDDAPDEIARAIENRVRAIRATKELLMDQGQAEEIRRLRVELASAGVSLMSYEQSEGSGGGIQESFEIARLLGYEDNLTEADVQAWLLSVANETGAKL